MGIPQVRGAGYQGAILTLKLTTAVSSGTGIRNITASAPHILHYSPNGSAKPIWDTVVPEN